MAIASRPKPKTYHKKRQALHHRQSKRYLKAYSPYLPVIGIIGLGVVVNNAWSNDKFAAVTSLNSAAVPGTTRLASVTGNSSNTLLFAVMAVTFIAFAAYVITHWYRFHRLLNRGEAYIVKHPRLDAALVLVVTIGVVLTRFHN